MFVLQLSGQSPERPEFAIQAARALRGTGTGDLVLDLRGCDAALARLWLTVLGTAVGGDFPRCVAHTRNALEGEPAPYGWSALELVLHLRPGELDALPSTTPAGRRLGLVLVLDGEPLTPAMYDRILKTPLDSFRFAPRPTDDDGLERITLNTAAVVALVDELALRGVRTEVFGPLPFCAFDDRSLGVLARECLVHADYRSDEVPMQIAPGRGLSPWSGPLAACSVKLAEFAGLAELRNFFAVRRLEFAFRTRAFSRCADCPLQKREVCSAGHHLGPSPPGAGFFPLLGRSPRQIFALDGRPHPDVRCEPDGAGEGDGFVLTVPRDRRLSALRLNPAAREIWALCERHRPVADVVRTACRGLDDEHAAAILMLLDHIQRAGFWLLRENPARIAAMLAHSKPTPEVASEVP